MFKSHQFFIGIAKEKKKYKSLGYKQPVSQHSFSIYIAIIYMSLAVGSAIPALAVQNTPKASISSQGGIKIQSKNKDYTFSLGGFMQWDHDSFDGLYNNDSRGSESKLRRARLIFKGSLLNDYQYVLMSNYNNTTKQVDLLNAFIKYKGNPYADITVGRFKEPFGFEALMSAKWLPTIERSIIFNKPNPATAGLFIDSGIMLSKHRDNYTWALALVDDRIENANGKDSYGITGRGTYTPIHRPTHILHLGLAYSDRNPTAGTTFTLNEPLGVNGANKTSLFATTSDKLTQAGFELAYMHGPFSLQSEYIDSRSQGDSMGVDIDLTSYYVTLAYTLTGQARKYQKGLFKGMHLANKSATEIIVKYDYNKANIAGNPNTEADILTLGINYYANKHIKLALNYLSAKTSGLGAIDDGQAVSARFQVGF